MTVNWKKYWIVICSLVLCGCSSMMATIAEKIPDNSYEESIQIEGIKKADIRRIASAGKTRNTDILKKLGKPYRVLWLSTGEKAYFYYLAGEPAGKNKSDSPVKKIGFTFTDKNRLKSWSYIVGNLNDRTVDNAYVSVYQNDEDIISIINAVNKKTGKKNIQKWFGKQGIAVNNTYFYVFVREGQNIRDGINLVFDFRKNGLIKNIAVTHDYYEKIASVVETDVPMITCFSRFVSNDLSELEDDEKSAVAYYWRKKETQIAGAKKKATYDSNHTLNQGYRNGFVQQNEYAYGEEVKNHQNAQENIAKGLNKVGAGINIIMTIHDIKSGNISTDNVQNVIDNVNTLVAE